VALEIAARSGRRIASLDSMQVYRGMDIGTAKPTIEDRERVPHSMIDLVDPADDYSVRDFQREARAVIEASSEAVILAGGSGLHMRAVIDPLEFLPTDAVLRRELEEGDLETLVIELSSVDPSAGEHVDLANLRRVIRAVEVHRLTGRTPSDIATDPTRAAVARYESLYDCTIFGLDPGDALADRIDARLQTMLEHGLYDEVAGLVGTMGRTASQAVGYAQLAQVVAGELDLDQGVAATRKATIALARRQRAWFRRDPRVHWIDPLHEDPVTTVMGAA
jgi:tRNA dimethylallyltransferase